jgi:uncharacterized repeat protein (TIGR04138 family)
MSPLPPIIQLLQTDRRYPLEAYQFVHDALDYARRELGMGGQSDPESGHSPPESHVTGQQLCQAIRLYAWEQYGYLAKTVLDSWGVSSTSDFGEIVYNLISIKAMKKSDTDRREDFDDVYDFEEGLVREFKLEAEDR